MIFLHQAPIHRRCPSWVGWSYAILKNVGGAFAPHPVGEEWLTTPSDGFHRPHLRSLSFSDGDGTEPHHLGVVPAFDVALAEIIHVIDDRRVELLEFVDVAHSR